MGAKAERQRVDLSAVISRYGTIFAMVAVFVLFAIISRRFTAFDNLMNVLVSGSILVIVGMGQTIAFSAGELDMSTGNVVMVSNCVAAWAMVTQGWSAGVAVLLSLAIGLAVGLFNAIMTTKARIPSIIVTLGVSTSLYGIAYIFTEGKSLYGDKISKVIIKLATTEVGNISTLVFFAIGFGIFTYLFLNRSVIGRHLYAVGGNIKAANLSGVNTTRVRILALVICSLFSSIAGILLVGRLAAGTMSAGGSYTLEGISAVFIGMTCIRPGRANVIGTVVGVFLTYFLINGLTMMGVNTYIQNIVSGMVMIAAVALTASRTELKFFRS